MINLIRAEVYKLSKSMSIRVCFLLSCISATALTYISHCIAVGSMSSDVSSSASGLTEIVVVSILGSLLAGILVCGDFETKTIHDAVACGNGRLSIVISKAILYLLIVVLLLLPYMIATIAGVCSGAKFTAPFIPSVFVGILSDDAGVSVSSGIIGKIIVVSLVTMLVHAARLSICIPFAFKIRKPAAILAIGFAFDALIDLVVGLLKDVPVISDIFSVTPYNKEYLLLTVHMEAGTLLKAVISSIAFIIVMTAVTYAVFRRAEIK